MSQYLLDTNHVSHLLQGHALLSSRIQQSNGSFGISMTILGELYFAAYASQRTQKNLAAIQNFLPDVTLWPYDDAAAEEFGRIQAEQKAKGRPIPALDAQIAAVARVNQLTILTADHHFQFIANLKLENWLV